MKTLLLTLLMFLSAQASANFQSDLLKSKRGKTGSGSSSSGKSGGDAGAHWTLGDWLAQKNRVHLMDLWLAAHSHTPCCDLNLSAAMMAYTLHSQTGTATATTASQSAQDYQTDLNFWFINLNGEYQKTADRRESFGGAGGLRLLGGDAQSTSLVARYGQRRLNNLATVEHWDNRYVEGQLQLYIVEEFGLDTRYRYYYPATSNQGTRLEGHKVSAGVFFEFAVIRIFAEYFQEPLTLDKSGTITRESSDGYDGGLRIFF